MYQFNRPSTDIHHCRICCELKGIPKIRETATVVYPIFHFFHCALDHEWKQFVYRVSIYWSDNVHPSKRKKRRFRTAVLTLVFRWYSTTIRYTNHKFLSSNSIPRILIFKLNYQIMSFLGLYCNKCPSSKAKVIYLMW